MRKITRERQIIIAARVASMLFTPFYLPILGLVILFFLTYLSQYPADYKFYVLAIVYFFTLLLPTFLIHLYRKYQGWTLIELGARERRIVPYLISILSYFACFYIMEQKHIPFFMRSIVACALIIQIVCAIINSWWKISTHTAGIGGVAGALFVFADIFRFNPTWWMCLVLLIAGILGTSRMLLRQHTLPQVIVGFLIGFVCAVFAILKL